MCLHPWLGSILHQPVSRRRRHCTFKVSVAPFRLAEPSLPPGALLALPCHRLVSRPPGDSLAPPDAIPVEQCYWFMALKIDPNGPQITHYLLVRPLLLFLLVARHGSRGQHEGFWINRSAPRWTPKCFEYRD